MYSQYYIIMYDIHVILYSNNELEKTFFRFKYIRVSVFDTTIEVIKVKLRHVVNNFE